MANKKIIIGLVLWSVLGASALATPSPGTQNPAIMPPSGTLLELPNAPVSPSAATPAISAPAVASAPPAIPAPPVTTLPASPPSAVSAAPPAPMVAPPAPVTTPSPVAPPPGIDSSAPPVSSPVSAPSVPPAPAAIAAGPPVPALTAAEQAVMDKNPDILFVPLHLGNSSLLFTKADMNIIVGALDVYDKSFPIPKFTATDKDNLLGMINSLKPHAVAPTEPTNELPPPLPTLYLGSIVYYSPNEWSIWLNGRKLVNKNNQPNREFYVDSISRTQVELIWHPKSLVDTPLIWDQLTSNGVKPLSNIAVDEKKGTITLLLRPNQTFLPRSLAIREGLIKPLPVVGTTPTNGMVFPTSQPPTAQDIMDHPLSRGFK